ncbi:hypothetical protein [Thermosipho atlanticus]|uniref:DUF4932 domain-containing protein n=1 Tax=Thermosipho atlanticus DSM 15807 TaxID=1123380 RepID=A0A1M5RP64_9BACT|nr:hypothetical protein [Thermosipho atlanticus]SHH27888.1 hypothetical protein SAMN02745199_0529 [Thermosipho atlanticus DSM 15807]
MKQIVVLFDKGTNYIFHILAASGINFYSDYTEKYSKTLKSAHLEFLIGHKALLSFQNGHASELVDPIIFFPAYLNLDSQEKIKEYFDLLLNALIRDEVPFIKKYRDFIEKRTLWTPEINSGWFNKIKDKVSLIEKLGEIYIENFQTFETEVWPKEREKLIEVAEELNKRLKKLNLIKRWEELVGIDFKVPEYQIILVFAIKNGPNANSLGYDRNVFYSGNNLKWTIDFISHEVGTHIMFNGIKQFMEEIFFETDTDMNDKAQKFQRLYKAYECLAQFYNTKILGKQLSYNLSNFESDKYLSFYHKLYESGIRTYNKMLKVAMETLR